MKQITIITNKDLMHQESFAGKLAAGLQAHGYEVLRSTSEKMSQITTQMVACWGWRIGSKARAAGRDVLVMERGYIGDRYHWTALGWNGLNGRSKWPKVTPEQLEMHRFEKYHGTLLRPLREFSAGHYLMVIGQVPGDMSLGGKDLRGFYRAKADWLWEKFGKQIMLRPHPLDKRSYEDQFAGLQNVHAISHGPLDLALSGACGVICYNSNTAVDCALAGIPCEVNDEGSMVFRLFSRPLSAAPRSTEELIARETLLKKLAWRQWTPQEIAAGTPWEICGLPHEQLESFK